MPLKASNADSVGMKAVSALMADIGQTIGMSYSETVSTAAFPDIALYLRRKGVHFNVTDTGYSSFDFQTARYSMLYSMPVIVKLSAASGIGHAAILHGFKSMRTRTDTYYQWMPIGTYPPVELEEPDREHPENYVISTQYTEMRHYFTINWGWENVSDLGSYLFGESWMGYTPTGMYYVFW